MLSAPEDQFEDNRDQLVGCLAQLRQVEDRARACGLTAVVGRPRAGKTWLLIEVARRLTEEGQFLVGYYELKQGEPSHLPFAAADLYARWLRNAPLREQARQLWEQRRDSLIPRIGELVGGMFDALCSASMPVTSLLVQRAFATLSAKNSALSSGQLSLEPLAYDQVLALTQLVATISRKRIVLILDAWEQSPSQRQEFQILQTILRHQSDWSNVHIILGVRSPDIIAADDGVEAESFTQSLCAFDASAATYQLPEIDLSNTSERTRALSIVRDALPFTARIDDEQIVDLIGGYPGVLYHWLNRNTRARIASAEDLSREAAAAHELRYPDLHRLLDSLAGPSQTLVAILALLPRLNEARWKSLREITGAIVDVPVDDLIDQLIDAGVLEGSGYPTFGHDTRHQSARRWFVTKRARMFLRQSQRLILAIAADRKSEPDVPWIRWETLAACAGTQVPTIDQQALCLIHAACLASRNKSELDDSVFDTNYLQLASEHPEAASLLSWALTRRAHEYYRRRNYSAAIEEFTKCIDLPNAPLRQSAGAHYNRGLCRWNLHSIGKAIDDYSRCIESGTDDVELLGMARNNRGMAHTEQGEVDKALEDFDACINLPGVLVRQLATALIRRATIVGNAGNPLEALQNLNRCISLPKVPSDRLSEALREQDRLRELATRGSEPPYGYNLRFLADDLD